MKTDREVLATLEVLRNEDNTREIDRLQSKVRTMGPGGISMNDAKSVGATVGYYWRGKFYAEDETYKIPRGMTITQTNSIVV